MKFSTLSLSAAFFAASAAAASAVTASAITLTPVIADCDPNFANSDTLGNLSLATVNCGGAGRNDATAVNLGDPDGNFYSLGLQQETGAEGSGVLILEIDPAFSGSAMIFEVTNPSNHFEAAYVFVANTLDTSTNPTLLGMVDNGMGGQAAPSQDIEIPAGPWKYLVLLDASDLIAGTGSVDGFDIDSIKLSAVPVPAAALLLGTALIGMGALRRRG